jgi:glutamate 5-kinase
MNSVLQSARRIVIKVGSAIVTNDGRGLDHTALANWSYQIAQLMAMGKEVVLVSSGAVAEGMQRLGWEQRPSSIHELQAAAAVGQMGLVHAYETSFRAHQIGTAQVLLTHDDLADRTRYLNALSTLRTLLSLKIVPIINENDTVVTDEIRFGDNDTLGALVTNLIEADVFIILTDQSGLYTADPRIDKTATLVSEAQAGDISLEKMAGGAGTGISRGGMLTKILAAKRAARSGAHTIIASGREANVLLRLAQGERIGTQLIATSTPLSARKTWLADHLQVRGKLIVDQGAAKAISNEGKSLLPVGVTAIEGDFARGEVVACVTAEGKVIARGLVNYAANEAHKIIGLATTQIETALGYIDDAELIHRDNLVTLS